MKLGAADLSRLTTSLAVLTCAILWGTSVRALEPADIYSRFNSAVLYLESRGQLYNNSTDDESGTAFLISKDGHVITSEHLIFPNRQNYKDVVIRVWAGPTRKGKLVGVAKLIKSDGNDLALLQVSGVSNAPFVPLGVSNSVQIGDPITVMGYPSKYGLHMVTGIVSAKESAIQWHTDSALNFGNSGGPVFGRDGRVIGVVQGGAVKQTVPGAGEVSIEGIKFFVPIDIFNSGLGQEYKVGSLDSPPPVTTQAKTIFRSYPVHKVKNDHPVAFASHSKDYVENFPASAGYRIVKAEFAPTSANKASETVVKIEEGGRSVRLTFTLTSGPMFDQWGGWLHGSLLTEQQAIQ
jgi:hypothetical protein